LKYEDIISLLSFLRKSVTLHSSRSWTQIFRLFWKDNRNSSRFCDWEMERTAKLDDTVHSWSQKLHLY